MELFGIIKPGISLQVMPGIGNRRVLVKVNLLVFDATPEALDENVVENTSAPVHADSDVFVSQYSDECRAGKLNPLVGIQDFRL